MQHYLGLDLDEWFRGQRDWRTLQELIDELPRGSHYRAAIADDDEIAELVFELNPKQQTTPPLEGWTSEIEALTAINNTLLQLLYRGSDARPPLFPAPETALDRIKKRRSDATNSQILSQLLPGKK
ncbi:hypothetical protein AALI21_02735 [Corynebacteriaceae bacterium 6-324]